MNRSESDDAAARPRSAWRRHPMLWLVVGGPAVVVVAALVTAAIAFHGADPVVSDAATGARAARGAELPAVQARNQGAAPAPAAPER